MRYIFTLASIATLTACASNTGDLQRVTAISIGGNVSPDQIVIADVDRSAMNVGWSASVGGKVYVCGADDMVRHFYCVRR